MSAWKLSGRVRSDLDEDEMREAVEALLTAGCESLVIHFLHAYANPAHEMPPRDARETGRTTHVHDGPCGCSRKAARKFESRRDGGPSTPRPADPPALWVGRLADELNARAIAVIPDDERSWRHDLGPLRKREAAKTVMSGRPRRHGRAYTAERAGMRNVITYDMGGTRRTWALIRKRAAGPVSNEIEIGYAMPDSTCRWSTCRRSAAGGGSIARLDDARPDPRRAGKRRPRGRGLSPTDAVGRRHDQPNANPVSRPAEPNGCWPSIIRPRRRCSGRLPRTYRRAQPAWTVRKPRRSAAACHTTKMAGGIRMVSARQGPRTPRRFRAVCFGGAGPLQRHGAGARSFRFRECWCPARPGIHQCAGLRGGRICATISCAPSTARSQEVESATMQGRARGNRRRKAGRDRDKEAVRPQQCRLRAFRRHAVRGPDAHHKVPLPSST